MSSKDKDILSKATFILLCLSIILFTGFLVTSYFCDERPTIVNGIIRPIVYSENVIYFPIAGEIFANSLVKYIKENNLKVCGLASRNTLWTKGYIVVVHPKHHIP